MRRILVTRSYVSEKNAQTGDHAQQLAADICAGTLTAESLLPTYCTLLYGKYGNLEEVARRTNLDRRTVKRYLTP